MTSHLGYLLRWLTQTLEAPVTTQDEVASEEHGEVPNAALLYGGVAPHPAWGGGGEITWLVAGAWPSMCTPFKSVLLDCAMNSNSQNFWAYMSVGYTKYIHFHSRQQGSATEDLSKFKSRVPTLGVGLNSGAMQSIHNWLAEVQHCLG